ncbi:tetratricopeptide repeat protein 36 isoform X1 [Zonotrichia leucophrys gambelii]|uniref:tetratricopeptide repeat protein 36 isoform X1 n=1 Tax=Zonotrichia leucophrys gambelii TaxID=257770 RepID=UPI00313FFEA8
MRRRRMSRTRWKLFRWSCWIKCGSWSCRAFLRLSQETSARPWSGSARPFACCPSAPRATTTGPRRCVCAETWQVSSAGEQRRCGRSPGSPSPYQRLPSLPGALQDLDAAIRLSRGRGRAACQSFVQRGLIHRLQARDEDARRDLERAARLGSAFARQQLVLLNPYSALCNQMLCEMLGRLRNPDGAGSD